MRRSFLFTVLFVIGLVIPTGNALADGAVIAFYTLNQTAADLTGFNPDALITNAPYEDGGVYLNGKYVGTEPDGSMVRTPSVAALDFSAMSVRVDFKISEWPANSRPILFCGSSWRWMGASLTSGGHLTLDYNGFNGPSSSETVSLDVWHTLAMVHDGTTGHLILDGVEVASQNFVPTHGDDRRFITHNGGNGTAFMGHIRNLVVYNGVVQFVAGVGDGDFPVVVNGLRNYPNPFNPATTIAFALQTPATASLTVFDLSGRIVQTLLRDEFLGSGPQGFVWRGTDSRGREMPSGTYFYRLDAGNYSETNRMVLVK